MYPHTQSSHTKWPEIKVDIKKSWNKIADMDLENTKGDFKAIGNLLQKNYGDTTESYDKKLSEIFKRFEPTKDAEAAVVKGSVKN